ncbi:4991_t:CDS:2 [Acaulospora colombiana]|uniref:4991_t:CDS:1 n=1 Tax=Acaulospora colombiana TaxID=27376 RepID=A0ACA9KQW8_9GLOM|nr:4991_t:CDS:2 [Acaulospora colombiana]
MQSIDQDTDEVERIRLLRKISSLESNELTDPPSTRSLRGLKSQYNALIETSIQTTPYPDLFEYLPTEIWMDILLEVIDDDCLNILPLTQGLPLYMTIDIPITPILRDAFLQREANRIQYLKIKMLPGHSPFWSENDNDPLSHLFGYSIGSLFKDLGQLPLLESLTSDIDDRGDSALCLALRYLNAPNIKYVTHVSLSDDALALPIYTGLRSLETYLQLGTVIPKLVKFTDLKELVLSGVAWEEQGEQEMPPESYIKTCKYIPPLEYLRSHQRSSNYIWPLLTQVTSSIRVLKLEIRWGKVFELLTATYEAHYLHQLQISIFVDPYEDELKDIGWKTPTLLQLQEFGLKVYPRGDIAIPKATHILLNALDGSLVNIQTLHLDSDIVASDLVRFLKGMEHLNVLNIKGSVENDEARRISCPALKRLVAETEGILRYVSMPNLFSLTIQSRYDLDKPINGVPNLEIDRSFVTSVQSLSLDTRIANILIPDGTKFTQLLTLEWIGSGRTYFHLYHPFPSLTKITFAESNQYLGASSFCELLLRYPRLCPRLETVYMHEYPEWDMLLYMLLRRNVYQSQDNISRITSIGLPGYPAPSIVVPLNTLLLGKIPLEIPSLEGVSYMLIYSDPAMRAIQRRKAKMPQGSDPPLPNHLRDWFDIWKEREYAWAQKGLEHKDWRQRKSHCARHNYSRLVVIDGHTLDVLDIIIDSKELEYPVFQIGAEWGVGLDIPSVGSEDLEPGSDNEDPLSQIDDKVFQTDDEHSGSEAGNEYDCGRVADLMRAGGTP